MLRTVCVLLAAAVVAATFTPVRAGVTAAPYLTLDAPPTYMTNTPFNVDLRLHDAIDLNAYNIVVSFTAPTGTYGTDFYVVSPVADPSVQSDYVFGANGFGFVSSDPVTGDVTVGDLLSNPTGSIDTSSPGQDLIATFTVQPVGSFAEPITVTVLPTQLDLLDPTISQVLGYQNVIDTLPSAVITSKVPEPASLGLLAVAGAGLLLRRRAA